MVTLLSFRISSLEGTLGHTSLQTAYIKHLATRLTGWKGQQETWNQ